MTSETPQQDNFRDQLVSKLMEHVLTSSTILEKISQKLISVQDMNVDQHKTILAEVKELEAKFNDVASDLFRAIRAAGDERCEGCLVRSQAVQDLQAFLRRSGSDTQRLMPITEEDLGMGGDETRESTVIRAKPPAPPTNWAGVVLSKMAENKIFWVCVLLILIAIVTAWNIVDVEALIIAWNSKPTP